MITPQQKEERRKGIGGSDIPTLFGFTKKYKTPLQLYFEKLGLSEEEDSINIAAEEGTHLEPLVLNLFEKAMNTKLILRDNVPTLIDSEFPYMRANIDGLMSDGSIVEAKTVTCYNRKKWGEPMTGEIPVKVAYQCAFYCSIYKATQVYIPVLFRGSSEFQIYVYTANYEFQKTIRERVIDFWENHILKQIPPMATTYEDLLDLYPSVSEGSTIELKNDILNEFESFISLKDQIKKLENKLEDHKFILQNFMGDHEFLIDEKGDKIASFKYNSDSFRLDTTALKKNDPIIYNLYKKPSKPTRVFKLLSRGKQND